MIINQLLGHLERRRGRRSAAVGTAAPDAAMLEDRVMLERGPDGRYGGRSE